MEIEYLNILDIYSSYYSPWCPSNLPDLEISYKSLNFQFDVKARLWSFFFLNTADITDFMVTSQLRFISYFFSKR